ncbi:hypothetical protein LCGC14_1460960 [marine sediment metagenome]|uniref:Uncharacterized protein n=1 Tax=marine sediment metagenome TaxID=412755 RepID=A0A0F9K157_9ZZZZ
MIITIKALISYDSLNSFADFETMSDIVSEMLGEL